MKFRTTLFLLTLLLSVSLVAQDSFVRSTIIDPPSTYASGFGATVSGVDLDGDGKIEIYSVDGMSDFMTGDEIPQIIKYELNGTSWDSVWAASFPTERQNTWAALTVGDLDGDGKKEIIWGYAESFSTNTTPDRVVVFEADGDDVLGIADGDNFLPNTAWNMDVTASTSMRPLKWETFDIDADGKEELIFAERRDYFNFAIISVDDVPDAGTGSEVWTMEFNKDTELYDQFLRSNVIESPDGGFGNIVTGVDLDSDGLMDLYAVNNNWGDGPNGELIPKMYKYELVSGAWILKWTTIVPGISDQNTWPVLLSGDMDNDGLGEVIFCPANNLATGNEDPSRIVVYETADDSSDVLGIDNGDGTFAPNARWNMGVPFDTEMRPFSGALADVDNDGTVEFVFGERRAHYGWGVASVDDVPNTGDGSETWTMEAAGANILGGMNLNITFEDDSDIANWSHWDETNSWTTETHSPDGGVDSSGALELGDAGYAMLAKRPLEGAIGATYTLSMHVRTENWDDSATYPIYVTVQSLDATPDTVYINGLSDSVITFAGTVAADAGFIKIHGENTLLANTVWVDNVVYTLDDGSTPPSSNTYHNVAVDSTNIFMFRDDGTILNIDGANSYAITKTQVNPVAWNFRSNNNGYDVDGDGLLEFVVADYSSGGSHSAWLFTQDTDSLKGGAIADFTANTANRPTGITIGDIDGDNLADILVGFRQSDEVQRAEYNGSGDILDPANYTLSILDKGVVGDALGQIDIIVTANVDGNAGDEVFYSGPPRSIVSNTLPLTVGNFVDTLTADAGRRWDMVVANDRAHFFDGSGNLQSVYDDGNGYKLTKTQPGLVNGAFLSASATDVDGDGTEEIIVGNWYDAKVNLLSWVNGAWVASEVADFTDVGGTRLNGGAVGDIDGDGNVDFVTGSRGSIPNGQIYRVEYAGGDIMDAASWNSDVIDFGLDDKFSQYEVINIANLDADADLEVLYTSDYARGPNTGADAPFPIVILDLQAVPSEPIADARVDADGDGVPDRFGETVTVSGVITSPTINSLYSLSINIQDETAGINVYSSEDSIMTTVGDLVQITGEIGQYNGLTQLVVADRNDIVRLGTGTIPTPINLYVAEWLEDGEKYESMLIKISAVMDTGEGDAWPDSGSDANLNMSDGYMDFTMRVDKDLDMDGQLEPVYPADITGVTGQYSTATPPLDGYQLFPRYYTDIAQDVAAAPSPYFFFTDETAALDSSVLEITDAAADYPFIWHPSVDLNDDALIYQFVVINPADDAILVEEVSDNGGADTTFTPTGQDIMDLVIAGGGETLDVLVALRTTDLTSGVIASVDTIFVTLKDMVTDVNDMNMIPKVFSLSQNYPNPFNPATTIQFGLPTQAKVNLIIYDILGREVARLVDNQIMAAGIHQHTFDASRLASGTYIYRLQADQKVAVKKMILLK